MPFNGALHYALLAKRSRYVRLDDTINAATFPHLVEKSRASLADLVALIVSGPSRPIAWTETLTDIEKVEAAKANEEMEESMRKLGIDPDAPTRRRTPLDGRLAKPGNGESK